LELISTQNYTIFNIIINVVNYKYPDVPSRNKLIIRKPRVIYRYNILLLCSVHGITDIHHLEHCVSEAAFASVFRQGALKMPDPFDQAILSKCVQNIGASRQQMKAEPAFGEQCFNFYITVTRWTKCKTRRLYLYVIQRCR